MQTEQQIHPLLTDDGELSEPQEVPITPNRTYNIGTTLYTVWWTIQDTFGSFILGVVILIPISIFFILAAMTTYTFVANFLR
jgi:hypothetical protein